tara:strand:+ start:2547 stop:2993 length:447 start_codon:yes stop_codon:yes gene_type:complete
VELEDGSFGLFECPYCDEEFEFELEYEPKYKSFNDLITDDLIPKSNSNLPLKLGICLFFGSALIILFGILSISNTSDDYDNTSTTCEESLWIDNWYEDRGCSTEGDYGAGSACGGIFMIAIGSCFGIASIVPISIGSSNSKKVILIQE